MNNKRKINGIVEDVKYYLHGGIPRVIEQKRLEKYSSIIWGEMIEENRKLSGTTMMIKTPRKSSELTTNRAIHQNRAAGIAMIVADKLGLNTRIVEIAAMNHDLGHTPYGHSVEWWESEIFKDIGMGYRCHNAIGVKRLMYSAGMYDRIINKIKEFYPKLSQNKLDKIRGSLWLLMDPILCHNGESSKRKLLVEPNLQKTEKDFEEELSKCYTIEGFDRTLTPATAEGSMFRIVDVISYVGQDMIDGLREGIITDLDEEYRQMLGKFGITENEIDLALERKSYDELARKIELVAVKDLIENSSKNRTLLSKEMLDLVCKLKDKNNKAIVDKVVRPTENSKFPEAIGKLLNEFSYIFRSIDEKELHKIMFEKDKNKIKDIQDTYRDTPYGEFITYICNITPEDYEFTRHTTELATTYATSQEVSEILTGGGRDILPDKKYIHRSLRMQEMSKEIKELYPNGMTDEEQQEYVTKYIRKNINGGNPNFYSINKRIGIAIGANYIETLNDKEFIKLLETTKLLSEEELKDINIKYNQIPPEELDKDTRQDAWKNIARLQRNDLDGIG